MADGLQRGQVAQCFHVWDRKYLPFGRLQEECFKWQHTILERTWPALPNGIWTRWMASKPTTEAMIIGICLLNISIGVVFVGLCDV